jgi:hypothetical protein
MILINIARAGVIDDAPTFAQIGLNILNFLLSVAGVIVIISLMVSGILYFISAGDEKKISQAKKSFWYAVVGIAAVMAAMIMVKTINQFL